MFEKIFTYWHCSCDNAYVPVFSYKVNSNALQKEEYFYHQLHRYDVVVKLSRFTHTHLFLLLMTVNFMIDSLKFDKQAADNKRKDMKEQPDMGKMAITAEPHIIPNRGPYPYSQPKQ